MTLTVPGTFLLNFNAYYMPTSLPFFDTPSPGSPPVPSRQWRES